MNDLDYIFAVARIRVKEKTLLRDSDIAQMITMPSADTIIEFLLTHGWGDTASSRQADVILAAEEAKTLALINELQLDPEILEVLSYPQLFHNLKAGIKETVTEEPHPRAFYPLDDFGRETMLKIIKEKTSQEKDTYVLGFSELIRFFSKKEIESTILSLFDIFNSYESVIAYEL